MDKKELKTLISNLTRDQKINVTFRGDLASQSGDYEVLNTKKGKGKGGSMLAELRPMSLGETVIMSTPMSDSVLNVTIEGKMFGFESEDDVPVVIKPNGTLAGELKETLKSMVPGNRLEISSTLLEDLNGVFTLSSVRASKGRYGQVVATLVNSNGKNVELWSYKHSGAVASYKVV